MRTKIFAIFSSLLVCFISNFIYGAIPASERAALIDLYNATNGDGWINNSGWKTTPLHTDGFTMPGTEGSWYGITVHTDHVTRIELHGNQLDGSIPSTLGNLSNLDYLALSDNRLSGSIPMELGNPGNLRYIFLYRNQLNGNIPSSLGQLSNLHTLNLALNQLSGTIPIELGNLSKLTLLLLSNNRLSGSIPPIIGNLSDLTHLSLNNNQLSGTIPIELGNLSKLSQLFLGNNSLSGSIPPTIWDISGLTHLHLNNNQLSGTIPIELGNLSKLTFLLLSNNKLSGSIPPIIGELSGLNILYLSNNQLNGIIPSSLGNLSKLRDLSLNNNYLSGEIPTSFTNLTQIISLDIGYNCLTATDPALRAWLNSHDPDWEANQNQCGGPVPTLAVISPNGGENWVVDSSHSINWTTTGTVGNVKIEYTKNNGSSWTTIISSTANTGSYSWTVPNKVSSQCKIKISEAPTGTPADISDNTFSIIYIGVPKQERAALIALYNSTNGDGWTNNSGWKKPPLHTDGFALPGTEESWYGVTVQENHVIYISLDNNQLSGSIPEELGNFGNLYLMFLCHNFLSSEIPTSLTNLTRITTLDIGYNCLTATDPALRAWLNSHDPDWEAHQDQCGSIPPAIRLNRTQLNFCALLPGRITGPQEIWIINSGGGTLNWNISTDVPWLDYNPVNGIGNGIVTVSVSPAGLADGTYSGTIVVSDPNAANSPQIVSVTLKVKPGSQAMTPFGEFSTPGDGSTVSSSIPVTGWVLDDLGVQRVKIYREEGQSLVFIGDAVLVEGARPDVEAAYPDYPFNYKAGWGYMMLTNFLPNGGNGVFKLHAVALDVESHSVDLGVKTITVDNAHAVKPFGAIDTPPQGGTASGISFINWGWVLTPHPNKIPINGSTILVWIDGIDIGHPVYNKYRKDIAELFPGCSNSNGACGYFYLDTTMYQNGIHTIQWTAIDSGGNTDGIGSRYFSVWNSWVGGLNVQGSKFAVDPVDIGSNYANPFPVGIRKGYKKDRPIQPIYPDDNGIITIKIKELERMEIYLCSKPDSASSNHFTGYLITGNRLRELPIGSTLDIDRGVFYWQPGPGFIGHYHFVFVEADETGQVRRKDITVNIVPKFKNSKVK